MRLRGLLALTRPGLGAGVVLSTALAYVLARGTPAPRVDGLPPGWWAVLCAGASALNQVLEQEVDRHMTRTRGRPLPEGQLPRPVAVMWGLLLLVAGLAVLALLVGLLPAGLGLLAVVWYLVLYTPLKRRTSLNVPVGAVVGALAPMIGWSAVTGGLEGGAWVLGGILFLWQLPHVMAFAWLHREEQQRAGLRMLPGQDPSGRRTGMTVLLNSLALVPVSLTAILAGLSGYIYFFGALVLSLWYAGRGAIFWHQRSERAARRLWRASLVYLPVLLLLMVLDTTTLHGPPPF
jgi:protoheme IX farnesyltransferase